MKWTAALMGLAVAGTAAIIAPATTAVAHTVETDRAALIADQNRLLPSAHNILAVARHSEGFAGITAKGGVNLYWKGEVPKHVSEAIAAEAVEVKVLPARYSEKELLAEAERMKAQPGITAVGPLSDGSGLAVSVAGSAASIEASRATAASAVDVVIEPYVQATFAGRQNDSKPYFGGARWQSPGGICTTGFAVKHNGVNKMLTAGHCGDNGETATDGGGQVMGALENKSQQRDIMLINTSSAGWTFNGGWNSNTYKGVKMPLSSIVGTYVCTTGSITGQHCPIEIKQVNQNVLVGDGQGNTWWVGPLVKAEHVDELVAVGQGDSGGPVVATDWCDQFGCTFTLNYPMGTITAVDLTNTSVPCGSTAIPTNCGWRMFYADVTLSADFLNATILTANRFLKGP